MSRKQPSRSKRQGERRDERAPQHVKNKASKAKKMATALDQGPKSVKSVTRPSAVALFGLAMRVFLGAVIFVFLGLMILQISVRWRSADWPTIADVGLLPVRGAVEAVLLAGASFAAWFACRSAHAAKRMLARASLLVALVCAGSFVGLRVYEYRELYADGLWQRSITGPIHERADIYYLQAVRMRLNELFQELDDRRLNQSAEFTEDDQKRLDVVADLQKNIVTWTEQEVGHWLEDLRQRRDVMRLVAYQIHPRAEDEDAIVSSVQQRRRELEREQQWFELLRAYCQSKSELLDPSRKASEAQAVVGALQNQSSVADTEAFAALDRDLAAKLDALGLADWAYAKSVIADTVDAAMVGERLNQVSARLDAMDGRIVFLDDVESSVLKHPESESLNRKYRWLRLPVCLPGGNAWAGGYFALGGSYVLLLCFVAFLSLVVLIRRIDVDRLAGWHHIQWWWYTASVIGMLLLLLSYLV